MEEINCSMCDQATPTRILVRTDDWTDAWPVCDECARAMLDKPALSGMWREICKLMGAFAGSVM
jgi:hypothetical protein